MEHKKQASTKKRVTNTPFIIKCSLFVIMIFVIFATTFKIVEAVITSKNNNFPKLEISLAEVPIEEINAGAKSIKYPGNSVTVTIDNQATTYSNVEIKGRGNSTWGQIKKPYQIKFENKESFFDIGKNKKWVLLANYLDPSHLRNDIIFYLEKIIEEEFNMEGSFVEVFIDGRYHGLYYLSEKVEINKHRVDLQNELGVLIEIDDIHGTPDECNYDSKDNCIVFKDFVNKDNESDAKKDIFSSLESLYEKIAAKDFDSIAEIIDIDSFVKYYLLSEFTVNPDAYSSSFYMYKDGFEDKLHAGPGWDFDLSLGNPAWSSSVVDLDTFYSPFEDMELKHYTTHEDGYQYISSISTLFYDLMDIPEFEARVKEIYQSTLSGKKDDFINYIKSQADYIRPAAYRDQERWKLKGDFDEEVDSLIDWVAKRYDHFEETYGKNSTDLKEAPESPQPSQEQPSPQETPPSA